MTRPRPGRLAGALLGLLLSAAAAGGEPSAVVDRLHQALIPPAGSAGEDRYRRIESAVLATHDLRTIGRVALGRYWSGLGPEQQEAYLEAFTRLSIATYADRFADHDGKGFAMRSERPLERGNTLVRATLTSAGGQVHRFDYLLHPTEAGPRIVNIVVDGVSDLALKRAEYGAIMRDRGYGALMAEIRQKIEESTPASRPTTEEGETTT